MRIYFAGPLFSQAEIEFNLRLTKKLEKLGYEVFLPQRDGVERDRAPYTIMSDAEKRKTLFEFDKIKILECDIFLFVLDGRVPDEGACVELGMAHLDKERNHPKRSVIGIHTDTRAAFLKTKLNPMIGVPLEFIAETEEQLIAYLQHDRMISI